MRRFCGLSRTLTSSFLKASLKRINHLDSTSQQVFFITSPFQCTIFFFPSFIFFFSWKFPLFPVPERNTRVPVPTMTNYTDKITLVVTSCNRHSRFSSSYSRNVWLTNLVYCSVQQKTIINGNYIHYHCISYFQNTKIVLEIKLSRSAKKHYVFVSSDVF